MDVVSQVVGQAEPPDHDAERCVGALKPVSREEPAARLQQGNRCHGHHHAQHAAEVKGGIPPPSPAG
jgi:hypothetical protein